ncbi:MAG: cell wall hydrolase [Pseudomonadota bacterium]
MPGLAQVTASSTTDPTGGIDLRLSGLMGAEHSATQSLSYDQLQLLGSAFVPTRGAEVPTLPRAADLDARAPATGGEEWACLTQALYFEARGESVAGQVAVAEVILNRVDDLRYPATLCGVVNEGTGRRYACQFTYTCDGRAEIVDDSLLWDRMGQIARMMIDGYPRSLTNGATHYHANWVNPRWASMFPQTAEIGVHLFYRRP